MELATQDSREPLQLPAYTRYLGLRDYFAIVSDVLDAPVEELATEAVIERAKRALDAPAAEDRSSIEPNRDLYPSLSAKAFAMCRRLLVTPPLPDEAAKVAFKCLDTFLRWNGSKWMELPLLTVIRFDEFVRQPDMIGRLAAVMPNLVAEVAQPKSRIPASQGSLFGAPLIEPAEVYMAGPVRELGKADRQLLNELSREVEVALAEVDAETETPFPVRFEHPSVRLSREQHENLSSQALWEMLSGEIVHGASALVVIDLPRRAAGVGAITELDLYSLQDGPILYVRSRRASHSRLLDGREKELDIEMVEFDQPQEIAGLIKEWVVKRRSAIHSAARRRQDREFSFRPLQRRLEMAWTRAQLVQRVLSADAAGMTREAMSRVVTSSAMLAVLPVHRLQGVCRELNVSMEPLLSPVPGGSQERRRGPDMATLLQAAEENGWPRSKIMRVREEALRRTRLSSLAARGDPLEPEDWVQLANELGN
ncbi:MAG TPA: hypothetical protein VGO66_02150 [Solirubrobacterales bacterium]|jgi:hypothetical protein|nr:hypothetical protein [Solirubrobacterales bacterium]